MQRASDILKKRPYHRAWVNNQWTKAIVTTLMMGFLLSIPFYRMVTTLPQADHLPPKTTEQLLEDLRPQIVEPSSQS